MAKRAKRDWEPITLDELMQLGRRIDSKYLFAKASATAKKTGFTGPIEELYAKLAKLQGKWCTLGGPVLQGEYLALFVVRPRKD